jgi:hypothetical protein
MTMELSTRRAAFVATLSALMLGAGVACAQSPKVRILSPARDTVLKGTTVTVTLEAKGIEIAPVADHKAGTAHHHLFLDTEVTAADQPIPVGVAGIVHLGKGTSTYTFENVPPGEHRLIAVLADPNHVPLKPLVSDTVRFATKP